MRVALVHDYLVQYGGAERVLEVFSEIFPHAPIYTLVYDKNLFKNRFGRKKIYTSFLQSLPLSKSHHRSFPILMPMAIESFDFSAYDIVLSDSNSYAKGIISNSGTLHICYCHTPMRYAWDDYYSYTENFSVAKLIRKAIPLAMNYIRLWDKISADRVDKFITNSNFVARRIAKYYRRTAEVIYPPVSLSFFKQDKKIKKENYFLIVGRLIPYKRFDLVIGAFNILGLRLKIIGDGPEAQRLKKMAKPNIEFFGWRPDEEIRDYYAGAKAFLFPQEEDFGIVALESLASGTPVIAYRGGGSLEIIKEGINGVFFDTQTVGSIVGAVRNFGDNDFDSEKIKQSVTSFDKEIFKKKIKEFVEREWGNFNKK
ncbi:MAG: glycosyltransferase [Patescibacteria group bacterium]